MLGHYLIHMQETTITQDHYPNLQDYPASLQDPTPGRNSRNSKQTCSTQRCSCPKTTSVGSGTGLPTPKP